MATTTFDPARPEVRTAYAVLIALSVCHLLNDTIQSLLPALYPVFQQNYGLSFTQIGFLLACLAPLALGAYLLWSLRAASAVDAEVTELLLAEITSNQPRLRLSPPPDQDVAPALPRAKEELPGDGEAHAGPSRSDV